VRPCARPVPTTGSPDQRRGRRVGWRTGLLRRARRAHLPGTYRCITTSVARTSRPLGGVDIATEQAGPTRCGVADGRRAQRQGTSSTPRPSRCRRFWLRFGWVVVAWSDATDLRVSDPAGRRPAADRTPTPGRHRWRSPGQLGRRAATGRRLLLRQVNRRDRSTRSPRWPTRWRGGRRPAPPTRTPNGCGR